MISIAGLITCGIGPTQAKTFFDPLTQTFDRYEINTPNRQAAFMAQTAYESGMLVNLEEDLTWRDPARLMRTYPNEIHSLVQAQGLVGNPQATANTVYAYRNGNGNYLSGDGWTYRGRGLIQLTGRANYTAAALALAEPYIEQPGLVSSAPDACLTAGWFWDRNRCNGLADTSDIDSITRIVNGRAMSGQAQRADLFVKFLKAFR